MHTCEKCKSVGLQFERKYKPEEFIEGDPASPIWIVGINPSASTDWKDTRSSEDLKNYFNDKKSIHSYFKDFSQVSQIVFDRLGKEQGVAHTDIVKCSSKSFPPEGVTGMNANKIIENCSSFLRQQIMVYKPKLLICNSAKVCNYILETLPPKNSSSQKLTYYFSELDGNLICIVLSGFIGRIDNYSKRRLGIEIERIISEMKIG